MSYKQQYIVWDVTSEQVQYGTPVGFDVELSQKLSFNPVNYYLNTYKENQTALGEGFEYSLDGGTTWIPYPIGDMGMTFYNAFKIRLKLNAGYAGYLFLENNGTVYKLRSDGTSIIESFDTGNRQFISDIDMDRKNGILYLLGTSTIFRLNTKISLSPYDNSIPIAAKDDALGIVVDGQRSSFWQINKKSICLRDLYGEEQFCVPLPDIDIEWSSSSSSSTSSSSSSSSTSSSSGSSSSSLEYSSSSSSSESSSSSIDSSSSSSESSEGLPTGMLIWLDADSSLMRSTYANGSYAPVWYDRSGNGYDFSVNPSYAPRYWSTQYGYTLNNRAVMNFTSGHNSGMSPSIPTLIKTEFTLFIVFRPKDLYLGAYNFILGSYPNSGLGIARSYEVPYGHLYVENNNIVVTSSGGTLNFNTPYMVSIFQDPLQIRTFLNGVDWTMDSTGVQGLYVDLISISGNNGFYNWGGDAAEFILYDYALPDAQRWYIEEYLSVKWGISL